MISRLRAWRDSALESFWFLPLVMVGFSQWAVLALLGPGAEPSSWIAALGFPELAAMLADQAETAARQVSADRAADVLSLIAGGMISLISIVFSLSFVALTLTSQQLGPRVVDSWLRENATQGLLGLSLSAFFAALTGLLALTLGDDAGREAVFGAGLSSILGGFALIAAVVFATRMADAIRADVTVARLGDGFDAAVRQCCASPCEGPAQARAQALRDLAVGQGRDLRARRAGYLGGIALEGLADAAATEGMRIAVLARENEHLSEGRPVARAVGAQDEAALERMEAALDRALTLTARRRRTGLPDFEGDSLVEVALRALSPSLNDPFTAAACIDRAGRGIAEMARLGAPSRAAEREGVALAAAPDCGAGWLADRLLSALIRASDGQPLVQDRLAAALGDLRRAAREAQDRAALAASEALLDRLARMAGRLEDEADRAEIAALVAAARGA